MGKSKQRKKRRNVYAAVLRTPQFRKRIVKSKKHYDRNIKHKGRHNHQEPALILL